MADFPERYDAFWQALADIPLGALDAGFARCMKSCQEFPVPAEVRAEAEAHQHEAAERHLREHTQLLLARPNTHPDFIGKSERELKLEFQRIVLESKASGAWGKELIEPAKAALAAMDRGETVQTPYSVHGLMSEVYGRPTR